MTSARAGALWGLGIFLFLWVGMLGTFGELFLVLPVVFIPVRMLHYFGIYVRSNSLLGRGVAAFSLQLRFISLAIESVQECFRHMEGCQDVLAYWQCHHWQSSC